jgi:hypothetical protein
MTSVIVAAAWCFFGKPFPNPPDGLLSTAATVASIFASFLGVSKAIILSIKGTPVYKTLSDHGYDKDLFRYLQAGIFSSIAFAAMSVIGFFISAKTFFHGYRWFTLFELFWICCGVLSLFTYVRISRLLFKLLKQV